MPSRAVVRKKARREAKRSKQDSAAALAPPPTAVAPRATQTTPSATHPVRDHVEKVRAAPTTPREKQTVKTISVPPRAATKRPREVEETPVEPIAEGLTRKERRREVAKRLLERQLARVNAAAAAASTASEETEGTDAAGSASPESKERHDPRFNGGTFWRTRKERRARTLFLGGIPFNMTSEQVKDFINTVIDSDNLAVDYLNELPDGTDAVEEIDFLPIKHSKVRNTYVTLASVPIAGCAAAKLDGYKMDGRLLRCNFAADKSQRAIAINRRSR